MSYSLRVMGGIGLVLAIVTLSACPSEDGGGLLGPQHFPSLNPAADGDGGTPGADPATEPTEQEGDGGPEVAGIYSGFNLDGYFHIPLVAGEGVQWLGGEPNEPGGGEPGGDPVVPEPPPLPDSEPLGIGVTMLKRVHLMDRDGYVPPAEKLSVQQAISNLTPYRAIWTGQLVARHHPEAWAVLREEHQEILTFHTMSGCTARPDGASDYLDYDYIHNVHPEWFLLRDASDPARSDPSDPNNRIRWSDDPADPYHDRYFLDVGNPAFRAWAIPQILKIASGEAAGVTPGFDGVGMDNVTLGVRATKFFEHRAPNWTYADDPEAWTDGYMTYLAEAKAALNDAGYLLLCNHTLDYASLYNEPEHNWDRLLERVNAVMTEQLWHAQDPSNRWTWQGSEWETIIARHEQIQAAGVLSWTAAYPQEDPSACYHEFKYGYCSWLMHYEPGLSLFYATRGNPSYANPTIPWFNDYTLPLGAPTSARYKIGNCWLRDFENARVYVNITQSPASFPLADGPWYDSGSGLPVETAEVPALSGVILLKGLP